MVDQRRRRSGPPFAWRLAVGLVVGLCKLFGWKVEARLPDDPPPPDRPLVVVANHTSNVDPFVVADTVWRRLRHWVRPLGKAEVFEVPVVGSVGRAAGAIPVARESDESREQAYDAAVAALAEGHSIYIAPEGTVTHDGTLLPLRHGAARLALEGGADVLVVTHVGAQRAFSPVARLPHRGALVTMAMDVISAWPDDDEATLTGRIAATMLDRTVELLAEHPQADTSAPWWPPYANPTPPTATARENIEKYRASMAEAVEHARERMAEFAHEHHLDERTAEARERARHLAEEARERARVAAEEARERLTTFAEEHHLDERAEQARERARGAAEEARERARHLAEEARRRRDERNHDDEGA